MLPTWTGAKAGASWTITRLPEAKSMTSRSSAGIAAHSAGFDAAITSLGVFGAAGGAAAIRAIAGSKSKQRIWNSPVLPRVIARRCAAKQSNNSHARAQRRKGNPLRAFAPLREISVTIAALMTLAGAAAKRAFMHIATL